MKMRVENKMSSNERGHQEVRASGGGGGGGGGEGNFFLLHSCCRLRFFVCSLCLCFRFTII